MRRTIALALLALCACGQPPAAGGASRQDSGNVVLGATRDLPDWLLVARTADRGNVFINQRSIQRYPNGIADIWVEIRHGTAQLHEEEDADTRTAIRYDVERLHYRFACEQNQFIILERQFMTGPDKVGAEESMRQDLWRPLPARGIASVVMPVACRGR
jgi:hypothetical protein